MKTSMPFSPISKEYCTTNCRTPCRLLQFECHFCISDLNATSNIFKVDLFTQFIPKREQFLILGVQICSPSHPQINIIAVPNCTRLCTSQLQNNTISFCFTYNTMAAAKVITRSCLTHQGLHFRNTSYILICYYII